MKYLYYPGCSLKATGRAYEESTLAVFEALGLDLEELQDWNCCGATAYMSVDEMKAFTLGARNLALAERQDGTGEVTLVAPCSGCYLVLSKTQHYLAQYRTVRTRVQGALQTAQLAYDGRVQVKHPLDVLAHQVGLQAIVDKVQRPLRGLKVACYYGCQIVRPYAAFDDQVNPMCMDQLMQALGAEVVDWPLKTRCCGGSLMGTQPHVGLPLSYILLQEARKRGAQVVATACPLCQFNMECYQGSMRRRFNDSLALPVVYFTQLLGLALGISRRRLGLQRVLVPWQWQPDGASVHKGGAHVRA